MMKSLSGRYTCQVPQAPKPAFPSSENCDAEVTVASDNSLLFLLFVIPHDVLGGSYVRDSKELLQEQQRQPERGLEKTRLCISEALVDDKHWST